MEKICCFFLCLFLCSSTNAQQDQKNWRVGVSGGVLNYYGDLTYKNLEPNEALLELPGELDYAAYGIAIEKSISNTWGIRGQYTNGEFNASDRSINWKSDLQTNNPNFNRGLNVKTEIEDWTLALTYHFDNGKLLGKKAFLAPYLLGGVGWTNFKNFGDLYLENGNRYHYWPDGTIRVSDPSGGSDVATIEQDGIFETRLSSLQTEGVDYATQAFHLTVGAGLKFRLTSSLNLNIETQLKLTNTDYLDDVSGEYLPSYDDSVQEYAAKPGITNGVDRGNPNGKNDRYSFTSIGLHYNFSRKKEAFNVPFIRIGQIQDLEKEKSGLTESLLEDKDSEEIETLELIPIELDTQAIYAVAIQVDSSYLTQERSAIDEEISVDTFYRIGTKVFDTDGLVAIDEIEDYNILFDDYAEIAMEDTSEFAAVLDTQIFYKINTVKDTIALLTEAELADEDFAITDTFYQVGYSFFSDENNTQLDQSEWELVRDNFIDFDTENPLEEKSETYSDYLNAADSLFTVRINQEKELLLLKEQKETIGNELAKKDTVKLTAVSDKGIEKEVAEARTIEEIIEANKLVQMEKEIEELKAAKVKEQEEKKQKEVLNAITESENEINEEILKMRLEADKNQDRTSDQFEKEIQRLRNALNKQNQQEISAIKKQLDLLENENSNLKNELADKSELQSSNVVFANPAKPVVLIDTLSNANNQILQDELRKTNATLESMAKILEQQQTILNNNAATPNTTKQDLEINYLKREVLDLKNRLSQNNAPTTIPANTDNDKAFLELQKEILELKSKLESKPTNVQPTTIIKEVPTAPVYNPNAELNAALTGREKSIVFFSLGSSRLSDSAGNTIEGVKQLMQRYNQLTVLLEGYTDPSGDASANLRLSKKRVESVRMQLMNSGISSNRIILEFRGEDPTSDASFGRRVELKILR